MSHEINKYENSRIEELKEKVLKLQIEIAYLEARKVISSTIEECFKIPNDYLREIYGEKEKLRFDWHDWSSSTATEKWVLKRISDEVRSIKEHYTDSNLDWVKPLKQATKDYFAYINAPKYG
jgi:hypothetical protein